MDNLDTILTCIFICHCSVLAHHNSRCFLRLPMSSQISNYSSSVLPRFRELPPPTSRFLIKHRVASHSTESSFVLTFALMSVPIIPEKWKLISWAKKDEQFARIPTEWLLRSSPSPDVKTYTDIPRKCGILNEEELRITEEYDAVGLAEAIRKREVKCVDVARAFCKVCIHSFTTFANISLTSNAESSNSPSINQLPHRNSLQGCPLPRR